MGETLFGFASAAMAGWLLMILAPGWSTVQRVVMTELFPIFLAILYAVGIVAVLSQTGPGLIRDFGDVPGVLRLLTNREIALVAWIHILAFDHLVGVWIFRDNFINRWIPWYVQSVVLIVTLMFGPLGYLLYTVLRIARGWRAGIPPRVTRPTAGPVVP